MSLIVEGILRQMGFRRSNTYQDIYIRVRENDVEHLCLSPHVLELLDKVYAQGHRDGWERGAYEELTKEDC